MAITRDATSTSAFTSASSQTWSHTCTGSNLILFVFAGADVVTISGVTYNGVAMTQFTSITENGNRHEYGFYMINPPTGAHNIVVTPSGTNFCGGVAASYAGVLQSGQPDAFNSANTAGGTASSLNVVVTTVLDNCWIVGVADAGVNNETFGGTHAFSATPLQSNASQGLFDTNSVISPAAATTIGYTTSVTDHGMIIGASIAPAIIATSSKLALLGVG